MQALHHGERCNGTGNNKKSPATVPVNSRQRQITGSIISICGPGHCPMFENIGLVQAWGPWS